MVFRKMLDSCVDRCSSLIKFFIATDFMNFSSINYTELRDAVGLEEQVDDSLFDAWIDDGDVPTKEDESVFKFIAERYRAPVDSFTEEEVKTQIIVPLVHRVDFWRGDFKDWYERPLKAVVNGLELSGKVDYVVAKGDKEPELPWFFIQEFKPEFTDKNPETQLLAELIAATEINGSEEIKGAFVVGSILRLMILKRGKTNSVYFVSRPLDLVDKEGLSMVYRALTQVRNDLPR